MFSQYQVLSYNLSRPPAVMPTSYMQEFEPGLPMISAFGKVRMAAQHGLTSQASHRISQSIE
jgi:hypothetical protein